MLVITLTNYPLIPILYRIMCHTMYWYLSVSISILFYPIQTFPILSYLTLSYLILSYPNLSISYAIFFNPLTLIFVVIKMTLHLPKWEACLIQNGTLQSQTKINFSIFKSQKKKPQMKIINFKKQKH